MLKYRNESSIPHYLKGKSVKAAQELDPRGYELYHEKQPLEFELVSMVHERFYSAESLEELRGRFKESRASGTS